MLFQVTGTCIYTYKWTKLEEFENSFSQSENVYETVR